MRWCFHKYNIISTEKLYTVFFIFMKESDERRTLKCEKCGKEKTRKISY